MEAEIALTIYFKLQIPVNNLLSVNLGSLANINKEYFKCQLVITMGRHALRNQNELTTCYGSRKQNTNLEKNRETFRKSRSAGKIYNCVICPYKVKNKLLLQYHVLDFHKTYEQANVLKCSMCTYKTLMENRFFGHLKSHHVKDLLYCAHCPFKAKLKSNLISHLSRHGLNSKFRCLFCTYSSDYQSAIHSHQWIHPEYRRNTIYQCIQCPYMTRIKSHFERHDVIHRKVRISGDVSVFKCMYCPFSSLYKSSLDRHNLAHKRKHGVQCKNCSYTARTLGGLALHKKLQCQDNKPEWYVNTKYKCTTCAYQTNQLSHYSRHLGTHDDSFNPRAFKCILCTFKCYSKRSLDQHFSSHSHSAVLQCSKCSFSTSQLALLNTHLLTVHKDKFQQAKLFSCSWCSYTTVKKSDLNRHITKHQKSTDINWVFCYECPFRAKRKYQLADHCKRHKLTEGTKCFHCSYRSSSKLTSWHHTKLHL